MRPRRATTLSILWAIVVLAWAARVVGVGRPARAEPLFLMMETLARAGARIARRGAYANSLSTRSL